MSSVAGEVPTAAAASAPARTCAPSRADGPVRGRQRRSATLRRGRRQPPAPSRSLPPRAQKPASGATWSGQGVWPAGKSSTAEVKAADYIGNMRFARSPACGGPASSHIRLGKVFRDHLQVLKKHEVEPLHYRDAMARFAGAVHVLTTDGPAGRRGTTVIATCSVSDNPPTVLVCINRENRSNDLYRREWMLRAEHAAGRVRAASPRRFPASRA